MAVNWCPCGLVVIVWPQGDLWPHQETVAPARISTSWPGWPLPGCPRWQFRPSIGGTWGLATCPMPLPGVITGHYGLGPVSRAGRNKPSGHLYYCALATYTIRVWPLTTGARVRLPRSCQPIPSRSFSIDLTLKTGSDFDLLLKKVGLHLQLFRC